MDEISNREYEMSNSEYEMFGKRCNEIPVLSVPMIKCRKADDKGR